MSRRPAKKTTVPFVAQDMQRTPFFDRIEAYSLTKNWEDWAGFLCPSELESVEKEYFAIRNQATLFDVSPMCKYRIKGPDAVRVTNRVITRNATKIKVGRVGYGLWCDEEGMVIDDGTIFRYGKDDFMILCQEHMYSWLLDSAWGFDVTITDESHNICGLSMQGPTSYSVLKEAGFKGVEKLKPFDLREIEPDIWISRTGYTGDLGYELFIRPKAALKLWDRLWKAGRNWGLIPIGTHALDIARLEAGFIAPFFEFQPVHVVSRVGRGRTPFELGFGKLVDFKKGHFNGRRALLEHKKNGPRYNLVRLDIEGKDPAYNAFIYVGRDKNVGHITSAAWSPTTKRNIALAELKSPYGNKIKDGLWVEIDVNKEGKWVRRNAKAVIEDGSFFSNKRARKTPPSPF